MTNDQLLEFVHKTAGELPITTALDNGTTSNPLLSTERATDFINLVYSKSALLSKVRNIVFDSPSYQLDYMDLADRRLRLAVENTAPSTIFNPTFSLQTITPVEVILPYDVTFQFLQQNLKKQSMESTLNNLFATMFANDLEDLCINGDHSTSPFLSILHGWISIAKTESLVNKVNDTTGTILSTNTQADLLKVLKKMPSYYKNNLNDLVFLVAPDFEEAYRESLGTRLTSLGDQTLTNGIASKFMGINLMPVPYFPASASTSTTTSVIMLTKYQNLAVGINSNMRVGRQVQERTRKIEYTISANIGCAVVDPRQVVIGWKA